MKKEEQNLNKPNNNNNKSKENNENKENNNNNDKNNYDMEFFMNKLVDLGKKPSCKYYMSRLRKIYKGEESWEII